MVIKTKLPEGSSLDALVGAGNDFVELATVIGFYEQSAAKTPSYDADLGASEPDYTGEFRCEYTLL